MGGTQPVAALQGGWALLRSLPRVAAWALLGTMAVTGVALGASAIAGWKTLTILSGSMSPAIEVGDIVVTRPVPPAALAPGNIVTFRDPDGSTRLITHRVVDVHLTDRAASVETRGDANPTSELWTVPADGRVGLGVYRLRWVGHLAQTVSSPTGRIMFIALPALALGLMWSPLRRSRPESWCSSTGDVR
jgi:signal peptidase I